MINELVVYKGYQISYHYNESTGMWFGSINTVPDRHTAHGMDIIDLLIKAERIIDNEML